MEENGGKHATTSDGIHGNGTTVQQKYLYTKSDHGPYRVYVELTDKTNKINKFTMGAWLRKLGKYRRSVTEMKYLGRNEMIVFMSFMTAANAMVDDENLLEAGYKAYIPRHLVCISGVLAGIPTDITEDEILNDIESPAPVMSVFRLSRFVDGLRQPSNRQYRTRFPILLLTARAVHYECLPYPGTSVCKIDFISYHPGDQISFPTGFQHYQFSSPRSIKKDASSYVATFDEELYEAMHRPSSIEMRNIGLNRLTLPSGLLLGDFAENGLASINVSHGRNYQIAYLDLEINNLKDIDFLSSLVNLEVLHLGRNYIESIPRSAITPLKKLKYLYLQFNFIETIPWNDLAPSLIHLDCYSGEIRSVVFINISLPSLEYLNLQHNELSEINVTELLRAAPNLKEVHLENVEIHITRMLEIHAELELNNISYVDPFRHDTCPISDKKCFQDEENPSISTGKALLLSTVVVLTAGLFMYITVVVFKQMHR
ncbi:uncharacterized protein LOC134227723 [Armigeres subalbatus]|uniref:uncharacterized protein LOC134227723 n=1 Tax=Armigeres subalbatus TaxID=124917 RepID=UPI002ED1B025